MSEDMPKSLLQDMPEKVAGDVSERGPEDMPQESQKKSHKIRRQVCQY